jgi:hypothetical protein
MPRKGLHSIIDLLDEFEVFSGRKVTIVVTNGIDVKLKYDPPLDDDEPEVIERSLLILEAMGSRIQ